MADDRQVIAVAGVGHLGRYVCEELLASPNFDVVVLTRQESVTEILPMQSSNPDWVRNKDIKVFSTDYTISSILSILDTSLATTMISFINVADTRYITIHSAILTACQQSSKCKRLIPSEWIGNIEDYPLKPDFYATTREPFRKELKAQNAVMWTLFNVGWLADYFLPSAKTYMKPIPAEFPIDPNGWTACVRGTGDEEQSWTCARDVGRGVVELCKAKDWEQVTYVAGEWNTFNAAIRVMEAFNDRPLPRTEKSWQQIQRVLEAHADDEELSEESELAQVEEMMVMSYLACPKEKTLRQREKYFAHVQFRDLDQLLDSAEEVSFV
ncbi:MAG: hypothetical protein Q9188_001195 [Gyalolechia gomerana]